MTLARCLDVTHNFLCGQIVSLFSVSALLMAKRLVYRDVSTPILLNLFFYLLLAVVYVLYGWRQRQSTSVVTHDRIRGWVYPLLALMDVQANVCAAKALAYTGYATTGLTLNLAIPFVFTMCACLFKSSYTWKHAVGCLITVTGALVILVGCIWRQKNELYSHDMYGWLLAFLAAALYAASNVANQWCLKVRGHENIVDGLGKLGVWGTLICAVEVALIERAEVATIVWDQTTSLLFVGYVLAMFAFYTAVFLLVNASETMVYNLSLLSSSIYLVLVSRYTLEESMDVSTVAATVLMLVGLVIYSWHRSTPGTSSLPQISFRSLATPRDDPVLVKINGQAAV